MVIMTRILFLLSSIVAFSTAVTAQPPNWSQKCPQTNPAAGGIMAYDFAHSQVVMFDGQYTWIWDGSNWNLESAQNGPPARTGSAMAYDAAHGQVVLFGGEDSRAGKPLNDTWVWDSSNWTQKSPVNSPAPRYGHAMAYDSTHGQIVLFGGSVPTANANDTWVWDGSNWTQKSPHDNPPQRAGHAMAGFPPQGVLLFGGATISSWLNDTWIWDGSNWTPQLTETRPGVRASHSMVYDSAHKQVVLFGGTTHGPNIYNDTWIWDGVNWIPVSPETFPGARVGAGMAYDAARAQVVLFGGSGILPPGTTAGLFNDTWIWSTGPATPPAIGGVITNSSFGGFSTIAPGSWIEIYGCAFGGAAYKPGPEPNPFPAEPWRTWTAGDFNGNNAPTSLDAVNVNIGGAPAFIEYISPTQINAQVPFGISTGTLPITVTNVNGTSAALGVGVNGAAAGLLAPASWKISGKQYVVATTADSGTYIAPPGISAGKSRPAKPGETIVLYGVGFGSVAPSIDAGQIVTQLNQLVEPFTILFGQTPAQVLYSGLAPGSVGLYQFNVVVPAVPDGDLIPLTFSLGGVPGAQTLYTAVHQ